MEVDSVDGEAETGVGVGDAPVQNMFHLTNYVRYPNYFKARMRVQHLLWGQIINMFFGGNGRTSNAGRGTKIILGKVVKKVKKGET